MATLEKVGPVWVLRSSYEERGIPKAAGLWWHGGDCRPGCKACAAGLPLKLWWTPFPEKAAILRQYGASDVAAELDGIGKAREDALVQSRATDAQVDVPAPAGLAYMPFQRAGIAYAMARPSTIIGDEMGLGKTIQALGAINADPGVKTVLVVCPATLRLNWRREAERWLVRPFTTFVIEGRELPPQAGDGNLMVIVNYDKLVGKDGAPLREHLIGRAWDVLVVDEAHYMKNPDAQRTQAVLGRPEIKSGKRKGAAAPGVMQQARRRLFLTGTPVLNKPIELFPLLNAVAPAEFPSYWGFAKRYCGAHSNGYGMDLGGATHLDELQERMRATCMVRRLKRDVLTELPAKVRQVIELPRNGAAGLCDEIDATWARHEAQMEELEADLELARASGKGYEEAVKRLRDAGRIAFEEIARAQHDLAVAKAPKVIEHVDRMLDEGTGKVILFHHHQDVGDLFAEHFGDRAVRIDGRTPMEDRQGLVDRFQGDERVQVFIGSITAAGVGITLTAASTVVFAELNWVPANITQAEDRAHRIGQSETVLIHHLVYDGSLDARMAKRLVAKQRIADDALDTKHPDRLSQAQADAAMPVVPRRHHDDEAAQAWAVTDEGRAAALLAVQVLAGVCDGAHALDGAGFSRFDVRIGHSLAAEAILTDRQAQLARRLAVKYQRQLSDDILAALGVERKKK